MALKLFFILTLQRNPFSGTLLIEANLKLWSINKQSVFYLEIFVVALLWYYSTPAYSICVICLEIYAKELNAFLHIFWVGEDNL